MPLKKIGIWRMRFLDHFIDAISNVYYYGANNPLEPAFVIRYISAAMILHLTSSVENFGLYIKLKKLSKLVAWYQWPKYFICAESIVNLINEATRRLNMDKNVSFSEDDAKTTVTEKQHFLLRMTYKKLIQIVCRSPSSELHIILNP